jgi:uncharacterized protein (DUF1684 family)
MIDLVMLHCLDECVETSCEAYFTDFEARVLGRNDERIAINAVGVNANEVAGFAECEYFTPDESLRQRREIADDVAESHDAASFASAS